ncbi:MAG: NAD-dependent epimerase/dehydratase family protein, partial [Qipengyuania vulgaris]
AGREEIMSKLRVLVTGISGRIGRHIYSAFNEAYDLQTLDRQPTELDPNVIISDLQNIDVLREIERGHQHTLFPGA